MTHSNSGNCPIHTASVAANAAAEPLTRLALMARIEGFSARDAAEFASEYVMLERHTNVLRAKMKLPGDFFSKAADDVVTVGAIAGESWHHTVLSLCEIVCRCVRTEAAKHVLSNGRQGNLGPYGELFSSFLGAPSSEQLSPNQIAAVLRSRTDDQFQREILTNVSARLTEDQLTTIISRHPDGFTEIFGTLCTGDLFCSTEIPVRLYREMRKAHGLYDAEYERLHIAVSHAKETVATVHESVEEIPKDIRDVGGAAPVQPAGKPCDPELTTPVGFLGGEGLAEALGIDPSRRAAFFQQLMRKRKSLGDGCFREVKDRPANSPRFLYRMDSPKVRDLAAAYTKPNPA